MRFTLTLREISFEDKPRTLFTSLVSMEICFWRMTQNLLSLISIDHQEVAFSYLRYSMFPALSSLASAIYQAQYSLN
jgi:hypothetical protein